MDFVGVGTVVNVTTVVLGSLLGLALGHRLPQRTSSTVTDVLGLFTLVIGASSIMPMFGERLNQAVGHGAVMVVILLAMMAGALTGSALRVEDRLEDVGGWARRRFGADGDSRFVNGFVTATLVFCMGPLTILGSLSDGLGRGADQIFVKSVLDGFASIAFAASLGIGVLASAAGVLVIQGGITLVGFLLGDVIPPAQVDALTVAGGIILLGLGIRLLGIKDIRVGDLLPALVFAPLFVSVAERIA
ncbi:DUF554 domain-containing protein [Luteococcus peritonei]|uniref:DUF554 domain-containing protein n=1 Tax=Luteococcus peritonei TaxID=88874 RepID=A0ABW4RYL6_9ACTN